MTVSPSASSTGSSSPSGILPPCVATVTRVSGRAPACVCSGSSFCSPTANGSPAATRSSSSMSCERELGRGRGLVVVGQPRGSRAPRAAGPRRRRSARRARRRGGRPRCARGARPPARARRAAPRARPRPGRAAGRRAARPRPRRARGGTRRTRRGSARRAASCRRMRSSVDMRSPGMAIITVMLRLAASRRTVTRDALRLLRRARPRRSRRAAPRPAPGTARRAGTTRRPRPWPCSRASPRSGPRPR